MKAAEIRRIRPGTPLSRSLPLLFGTRIEELWELADCLKDPAEVKRLHDMRIAAKRLRYLLEFFDYRFGDSFKPLRRQFKHLQDLLGEAHDCDVWVGHLARQAKRGRLKVARIFSQEGSAGAATPELAGEARSLVTLLKTPADLGVALFIIDICHRRRRLFTNLRSYWSRLENSGFRFRLEQAVADAARFNSPAAARRGRRG